MSAADKSVSEEPSARATAARLRVAMGAFKRRTHETETEDDLTAPQLTALARLDRFGLATTAELARREQITPQAMGATIASLEQLNLVKRSSDATDGRRSILSLTSAGAEAVRSGRSAAVDKIAAALQKSFTSEEIDTLDAAVALIERLADLL